MSSHTEAAAGIVAVRTQRKPFATDTTNTFCSCGTAQQIPLTILQGSTPALHDLYKDCTSIVERCQQSEHDSTGMAKEGTCRDMLNHRMSVGTTVGLCLCHKGAKATTSWSNSCSYTLFEWCSHHLVNDCHSYRRATVAARLCVGECSSGWLVA